MTSGMIEDEMEEELMKYTDKSTKQADGTHKQNADVETDGGPLKGHGEKTHREAVISNNESPKAKKIATADEAVKSTNLVEAPQNGGDDVDIIGGPKMPGCRLIEAGPIITSESSSSFGATEDSTDELSDSCRDSEATSSLRGGPMKAEFNRFSELLTMSVKRRKVSSQWKTLIQPLTWRLKWAELHMKMLTVFSQGYDRKLENRNKLKQIRFDRSEIEVACARQTPFSHVKDANHVMRRKKRKKAEISDDLAKYMSQHSLFSYYSNRRKNVPPASAMAVPKFMDEEESWASMEHLLETFRSSDDSSDASLRRIFDLESKIAVMKRKARKLLHDNSWMHNNEAHAGNPSSIGTYITAQLMSEYSLNDDLAPEDDEVVVRDEGNASEEVRARPRGASVINPNPSTIRTDGGSNVGDQSPKKIRLVSTITGPRSKRMGGKKGR